MSKQGLYFSITRKTAAGVMFEARSGRCTSWDNTSSNVVLPQPLVGELMHSRGDTRKYSAIYVCTTQHAQARTACSGSTT